MGKSRDPSAGSLSFLAEASSQLGNFLPIRWAQEPQSGRRETGADASPGPGVARTWPQRAATPLLCWAHCPCQQLAKPPQSQDSPAQGGLRLHPTHGCCRRERQRLHSCPPCAAGVPKGWGDCKALPTLAMANTLIIHSVWGSWGCTVIVTYEKQTHDSFLSLRVELQFTRKHTNL